MRTKNISNIVKYHRRLKDNHYTEAEYDNKYSRIRQLCQFNNLEILTFNNKAGYVVRNVDLSFSGHFSNQDSVFIESTERTMKGFFVCIGNRKIVLVDAQKDGYKFAINILMAVETSLMTRSNPEPHTSTRKSM